MQEYVDAGRAATTERSADGLFFARRATRRGAAPDRARSATGPRGGHRPLWPAQPCTRSGTLGWSVYFGGSALRHPTGDRAAPADRQLLEPALEVPNLEPA